VPLSEKQDRLLERLKSYKSVAVAFSAGVDSTVVAKAAQLAVGDNAVAVTGESASLAAGELDEARRLAEVIGIRHVVLQTNELADPSYKQNAPDRCYHCKTELYTQLDEVREKLGVEVVVNGANADDLQDYRPGLKAAGEHAVKSPLAELGFAKADVRELAQHWELPVWDKPAMPCLSSRIAYGQEVTPERLAMIDSAERFLRDEGLRNVRVRYHGEDIARIEVPSDSISRLADNELRERLVARFRELGFQYVTLDLEGFRSGSLNAFVDVGTLQFDADSSRDPSETLDQ
jgi:uncharacterized protein